MGTLLLSPGSWCAKGFVCALQESISPVLCKFWQLHGEVNGDLLQEGLCHTQVYCTQSSCPCGRPLLTYTSNSQTFKGRSGSVSVESPGAHIDYRSYLLLKQKQTNKKTQDHSSLKQNMCCLSGISHDQERRSRLSGWFWFHIFHFCDSGFKMSAEAAVIQKLDWG